MVPHLHLILQSEQTSAPSPALLVDSRGQMRVALRFLRQTSHSELRMNSFIPFSLEIIITYCGVTASTGRRTSGMETGEVQIWVKDCKNLPPVRGVIIDPFVKWYDVQYRHQRVPIKGINEAM